MSLLYADPYLQYLPSKISAASLALARVNLGIPIWSKKLEQTTGYTLIDLKEIIMRLSVTHVEARTAAQQAIQEKFKVSKYV